MALKFASLGSGSEGNALMISACEGTTQSHVMLDCGFGLKEVARRLARLQLEPQQLSGIVVTHEHSDHIAGVYKLARRFSLPVWMSHGSFQAAAGEEALGVDIRICRDGESFVIGDLEISPFTVPHDAREPIQYTATDGRSKLGVLTDVGQSTPHLIAALAKCDALQLEFNHDSAMLAQSAYPAWLKGRIAGPLGHLSNQHAADILASLDRSRLKTLVAAHLSQRNNDPILVREAIDGVVGSGLEQLLIADQEDGYPWQYCS